LIFTLDENDNIIATKTNVNTENMFTGTTSLDYDTVIGNVTQDTILDIVDYFNFSYSDALIEYEDIPNWDTSKITDMSELFQNFKHSMKTLVDGIHPGSLQCRICLKEQNNSIKI